MSKLPCPTCGGECGWNDCPVTSNTPAPAGTEEDDVLTAIEAEIAALEKFAPSRMQERGGALNIKAVDVKAVCVLARSSLASRASGVVTEKAVEAAVLVAKEKSPHKYSSSFWRPIIRAALEAALSVAPEPDAQPSEEDAGACREG